MNAVVEMPKSGGALAATQPAGRMAVSEIIGHVAMVQEVMRAVMKENVHFGVIPGTDKPTLYKAGAEVLCMAFRIADSYAVEDLSTELSVRYRVTCTGTHQVMGHVLGTGMGEASSGEEKYKWRKANSQQEFDSTPPNLRREKHIKPRSGAAFTLQQVRTEPADLANTILKMANKRAKMAMVLNVTAASDCFAQDLEDMDDALREHLTRRGEDSQEEGQQAGKAEPGAGKLPPYPDDKIGANLKDWAKAIKDGKAKSVDQIVAFIKSKNTLTAEQEKRIRDGCASSGAADSMHGLPPNTTVLAADPFDITGAFVLAKLNAAKTSDELDIAASLIRSVPEAERAALNALYDELHAKFNPQE